MIETYFAAELEKLAVSTAEIARGAKRVQGQAPGFLKGISNKFNDGLYAGAFRSPAGSTPTPRQAAAIRRGAEAYKIQPVTAGIDRFVLDRQAKDPGRVWSLGEKAVAAQLPMGKLLTPEGRKATHDVALLHEGYERGVRPGRIDQGFKAATGHLHPEVLLKEKNLRNNLTGPGSGGAKMVFDATRAGRGEDLWLLNATREAFKDPRAVEFLAEGQKMNRGMRKAFNRRYEAARAAEDPTYASLRAQK